MSRGSRHDAAAGRQSAPWREGYRRAVRRQGHAGSASSVGHAPTPVVAQSIANVVRNAVRYAAGAGAIEVTARRVGGETAIEVADRGPGVPPASLGRLFEPFYRPDDDRARETGGAGLGLAIVKTCVESCGGTVAARNRDGGGFAVRITLEAE